MIPAHWRRSFASPFPNAAQVQVLTAVFAPEAEARRSFSAWRSGLDLDGDFDPEVFRLLPMLYLRVCQLGIEDDLVPRLKGVYRHAWVRNAELFHDTGKVLAALGGAGIPTMVLKGAPLALVSYSKPAARPMGDLDVAVPKERAEDAIRLLRTEGWTSPRINLGVRSVYHATPFRNARGNEFDLHWSILAETSGKPIEARFWETARPFDFNGVPTRMVDPALALVHVLVHGLRTNPEPPVRWVADALTLVRRTRDLNWDLLVEFADAAQVTQRTHLGLAFINEHFDAPIPSKVLTALSAARHGLMERAETAAVLYETRGLMGNALSKPVILLTDYLRQSNESGLRRVSGFVQYVRRRLVFNSAFPSG
jgi:Uncharacterised nucleotidyltransferase